PDVFPPGAVACASQLELAEQPVVLGALGIGIDLVLGDVRLDEETEFHRPVGCTNSRGVLTSAARRAACPSAARCGGRRSARRTIPGSTPDRDSTRTARCRP